jgi:hypothetical protein
MQVVLNKLAKMEVTTVPRTESRQGANSSKECGKINETINQFKNGVSKQIK